jgi:hypothetical protein
MKITKISAIVFLITIISEMMNAQDTIYFKDKSIISSKIIEIGITEIQYRKFDNLAGPIYNVLKNTVKSIKYSNGEIDSLSFVASPNKEIVQIETNQFTNEQSKLQLRGIDLYYDGSKLRKRKTNQLIESNALTENQRNLIMEIKNVKLVGKDQRKLGTRLFVTGLIVPILTSPAAIYMEYEGVELGLPLFFIGVIAGAALRVTGHVNMKIGKNKAKAKKLEFITKHKNNEFIY